ncbi:MAG: glycosyltransferase family 4 protein [Chloroflexi bacterium]|nr:glycosyltransferase family 4 protein [Chloroflexota bacterium]
MSHPELAELDSENTHRQCVDVDLASQLPTGHTISGARLAARVLIDSLVPPGARMQVKDAVWRLVKARRRGRVARELLADLHFAPFTAPFFYDRRVPVVSVVHDVQFLDHPEWFDEATRISRTQHFNDACERADRLICVSEFVRQSVLAHTRLPAERVQTIHSTVLHASTRTDDDAAIAHRLLEQLGMTGRRVLLYPANPWPHKNHRRLIEAWAMYVTSRPDSDLVLVCTGAPLDGFQQLEAIARDILPAGRFAVAGFLDEREFAALLHTCRAVVFPSLYEGFGLPVLEAMSSERPVLCSNATSLPEIVGEGALLFDPSEPHSITCAIERLEAEPQLERALIKRGRERVAAFGTVFDVAAKYLDAFEDVAATRRRLSRSAR